MLGGGISLMLAWKVDQRGARFFGPAIPRPQFALQTGVTTSPTTGGDVGGTPLTDSSWHFSTKLKNHTSKPQLNEAGFRPKDPAWTTFGCFLLWLGW